MNIPNLPTDNIYKFFALFGLILLISSTYFYLKNDSEYSSAIIQTKSKIDYLKSFMDKAESTKKLRIDLMKDSTSFNGKFFKMVLAEEEYLLRKFDELYPETIDYTNTIEVLESRNNVIKNSYFVIVIISIFLIIIGFYLWKVKYQKFIDLELKLNGLQNQIKYDQILKEQKSEY